jgi:rhodanese-related sulfurtransferase
MIVKKHLIEAFIIVSISLVSAVAYNAFSANGIPLFQQPLTLHPGSDLSLREAYQLFREGKTLFIDSRNYQSYKMGHIEGAINIPVRYTMDEIKNMLEIYPVTKSIVTYCNGVSCTSSRRLAGKVHQLGYRKVYIFYDGWEKWQERHLPITVMQESLSSAEDMENDEN